MDPKTLSAYERNAAEFARRYRAGHRVPVERLKLAFGDRRKLLEIGVGSGIDMARLRAEGYDVTGIEPSSALRAETRTHFPHLAARVLEAALPLPAALLKKWHEHFDAVFCSAVLMHVPEEDQPSAMEGVGKVLRSGGRLMLTVSATRDGLDAARRDEFGRFYAELPPDRVHGLCEAAGLRIIQTWNDDDAFHRRGLQWSAYLAEKTVSK